MYVYEDLEGRIAVRVKDEGEFESWIRYCIDRGHHVEDSDYFYLEDLIDDEDIAFDICPHVNPSRYMTWSDLDWYVENNYEIISFGDLDDLDKVEIDIVSFESMLFE